MVFGLVSILTTGCTFRELLPMTPPTDGSLFRCSRAEVQAAGSVVSAGGRMDTCQCVTAGVDPGRVRVTMTESGECSLSIGDPE